MRLQKTTGLTNSCDNIAMRKAFAHTNKGSELNHSSQKALPEPAIWRAISNTRESIQELRHDEYDRHDALTKVDHC